MTNNISSGTAAQSFRLSTINAKLRADIDTLSQELGTGKVGNVSAHLKNDYGLLSHVSSGLKNIDAYQSVITDMNIFTDTVQASITRMHSQIDDFSTKMQSALNTGDFTFLNINSINAPKQLEDVLNLLNTNIAGQYVFAGIDSSTKPMGDMNTLLEQIDPLIDGLTTVSDIEEQIMNWLNDPDGFDAIFYGGGAAKGDIKIGENITTSANVIATDPTLKDTIGALLMSVYADRGRETYSVDLQKGLIEKSVLNQRSAGGKLLILSANIGIQQSIISQAQTAHSTQKTALEIIKSDLIAADPFETAGKLKSMTTQLEIMYTMTNRLSQLSIIEYLR